MKNSTKYIIIGVSVLALGASAFFILKKPKPKQIPNTQGGGGQSNGQGLVDDEPVRDNIENQLDEYSQTVDDETEYRSIADICREDFDNPICGN
jgi:hypothetical protein